MMSVYCSYSEPVGRNATSAIHWYFLGLHPTIGLIAMQISRVQWTFVFWMCRHLSSFVFLCLVMQHKIETDGQPEGLKNFCMNQLHKFALWWEGWHQCKCRLQNAQREHGVGTEGFGICCLLLHKQNQQCTWACLSLLDTRQFCRRMLECCVKASDCMHHLCHGNACNTMRNTPNVRANLQTAPQCLFLLNWGDHELEIRFVLRHDLLNDGAYWWAFDRQQCQSFTFTMAMPCVPLAKVLCLSILVCSQAWCCRNVADIFDAIWCNDIKRHALEGLMLCQRCVFHFVQK